MMKDFADYVTHILNDGSDANKLKNFLNEVDRLEKKRREVEKINLGEDIDIFDYDTINFEYKGYCFEFICGKPYYAKMVEPNGVTWECRYDYWYGAGFDDE